MKYILKILNVYSLSNLKDIFLIELVVIFLDVFCDLYVVFLFSEDDI